MHAVWTVRSYWRRPAVGFLLVVLSCARAGGPAQSEQGAEPVPDLDRLAAALGRPGVELRELDRRPMLFAYLEAAAIELELRDQESAEVLAVTVDADTGELVDPELLRQQDRELALAVGARLDPDLRELMLAHPELEAVRVGVGLGRGATAATLLEELDRLGIAGESVLENALGDVKLELSVREAALLSSSSQLASLKLLEDPVILDDGEPDD